MNASIQKEINSCIREIDSIVRQLYEVSSEIDASIDGMNTKKYTRTLESCAAKYNRAAQRLRKIK